MMNAAKEVVLLIMAGFRDCFTGLLGVRNRRAKRYRDTKPVSLGLLIRKLLCCFGLNGVAFGLTIYAFDNVLLPVVRYASQLLSVDVVWQWFQPLLSLAFGALWVLPLFVLSRVVNCVWFQEIADLSFEMACGPRRAEQSFSAFLSDFLNSAMVQFLFLLQSCLVSLFPIPFVGELLSTAHLCLLYSLYAFDYKWVNMGWTLEKRLAVIDYNWPYFVGFGLPLALATTLTCSYISRICLFSVLFPLCIVSGINSTPAACKELNIRPHVFDLVLSALNAITKRGIHFLSSSQQQ